MLNTKSLRSTRQRNAIKNAFSKTGRPLGPKEILDIASADVQNLGIATVYRNIKTMLEQHDLMSVEVPGQPSRYYLPMAEKHPLFLCSKTNRAFFLDPKSVKVQLTNLPKHFHVNHSEVIVHGEYHD